MIIFQSSMHLRSVDIEKIEKDLSKKLKDDVTIIPPYLKLARTDGLIVLSKQEFLLKDHHNDTESFNQIAKGYNFVLFDGDRYYSADFLNKKLGSEADG